MVWPLLIGPIERSNRSKSDKLFNFLSTGVFGLVYGGKKNLGTMGKIYSTLKYGKVYNIMK